MVKKSGYRIELGEIEAALYRHPRIAKVAVISTRDEDRGVRIVACCVADGVRPSVIDLKKFCHDHLPAYMSPDLFVWYDDLPLTSTGKIDAQELLRRVAHPGSTR